MEALTANIDPMHSNEKIAIPKKCGKSEKWNKSHLLNFGIIVIYTHNSTNREF